MLKRYLFGLTVVTLCASAPLLAQIEVADDLLVELDAAHESAGSDVWVNTADESLGDFFRVGAPIVEEVEGVTAMTYTGADVHETQDTMDIAAPGLVGPDPTRSIEAWVYNPDVLGEETIISWGLRGGGAGTNMSFNYGSNASHGAVGHWGAGPDIGWGATPVAGAWHHLVYTYDGTTTRVYADGVLSNSEELGAGLINTHAPHLMRIATQTQADGTDALPGTLSIARLRVHDGVLTDEQVANNYDLECAEFCPQPELCVCVNCPEEDETYRKELYVRTLRFDSFPLPDSVAVTSPAGATIDDAGKLVYAIPAEVNTFEVSVECVNEAGTATFSWNVDVIPLPAGGDIEVAEELLVNLDAEDGTAGAPIWLNRGSQADFGVIGAPAVEAIGPESSAAVTFNLGFSADAYQCFENAAPGVTGIDPTRTIEAWVFNEFVEGEETIISWGRRGGPDGSNMSFNYGSNGMWGAVGHWGGGTADIGWIDNNFEPGNPIEGEWHHLVYTYDGTTTRVYSDGQLMNSEVLGEGVVNTHADHAYTIAAQLDPGGQVDFTGRLGSISIGQIRVHDGVLSLSQIQSNYDDERDRYGKGEIEGSPPEIRNAPKSDTVLGIDGSYTFDLDVRGFPSPTLIVESPPGATIDESGSLSYDLPDPLPESFEVQVTASNDAGEVSAEWDVVVVTGSPLDGGPVHRYSFNDDASDSIGGADGTLYGDVTFADGQMSLNNFGNPTSSNADNEPSPPAPAPGAYVDLPNGMISSLGLNATFETWTTWRGDAGVSWQRIFDFGTSDGGEDSSQSGANSFYVFATPRSGANTLRTGYRAISDFGIPTERFIDAPTSPLDVEQHVVVTWSGETSTVRLYADGRLISEDTALHFDLDQIIDDNNWLGRSQFPDAMFDGNYNELRIYDRALSPNEVLGNFEAGPDVLSSGASENCEEPGDEDGNGLADCADPACAGELQCQGENFVRGDADSSGTINLTDGINILLWSFQGGPEPSCLDAADTDDSGAVNLTDPILIFQWLFLGGTAPSAPSPSGGGYLAEDCGIDPTGDDAFSCAVIAPTCAE